MPFAYDEKDREGWAAATAAALVAAAGQVRAQMAAKLAGAKLPGSAKTVYSAGWWDDALDEHARPEFERITGEAADQFEEGTGVVPDAKIRSGVLGAVVGAAVALVTGRGDVASERVTELLAAGEDQGWTPARLADELGVADDAQAGPLSDALLGSYGPGMATTLAEGTATGMANAYEMTGTKTWNCLFVNSRQTHIDADGQTVEVGKVFDIDGYDAMYPADPLLPPEESCNCNCWVTYDVEPAADDSPDGGSDGEELTVRSTGGIRRTPILLAEPDPVETTLAVNTDILRIPGTEWVTRAAAAFAAGDIVITVEPTAAEKNAIAIPGGVAAADLQVVLSTLPLADTDEIARQGVADALTAIAAGQAPLTGTIAGMGWIQDPASSTVALMDVPELGELCSAVYEALEAAGFAVDDEGLTPHMLLSNGAVDVGSLIPLVDAPVTFTELRLRWGTQVLVFDLLGVESPAITPAEDTEPIPESPAIAPTPPEVPTVAPQPQAPTAPPPAGATVSAPIAAVPTEITFAAPPPPPGTPPPDVPTDATPAPEGDLSGIDDDALAEEMARRVAQKVADDTGGDAGAIQSQAMQEVTDAINGVVVDLEAGAAAQDIQAAPAPSPAATARVAAVRLAVRRALAARHFAAPAPMPMPTDTDPADTPGEDETDVSKLNADGTLTGLAQALIDIATQDTGVTPGPGEVDDTVEDITELLAYLLDEIEEELSGQEPGADPAAPDQVTAMPTATAANSASWTMIRREGADGPIVVRAPADVIAQFVGSSKVSVMEVQAPIADEAPAAPARPFDWEGVLTVEDTMSGDGRMIAAGALTWRTLPLTLMLMTINDEGHRGSAACGSIVEIERVGNTIVGRGYLSAGAAGQDARMLLDEGTLRGVSVDIDSVSAVLTGPGGDVLDTDDVMRRQYEGDWEDVTELMISGRVMGATLCPFPAFQEAHVYLLDTEDTAVVAGAQGSVVWRTTGPYEVRPYGIQTGALVASAAAIVADELAPPKALFQLKDMEEPEAFSVGAPMADGTVPCYGLVAQFGTCHLGYGAKKCVDVPRNADFSNFYSFYTGKKVLTREGELVRTGPIIMDTVHPDLMREASDTQAFYADTGCAVADVSLHVNQWGIVAAGVIRPGVNPLTVRRLRGSDISPDWRPMPNFAPHKLVALLAVNASAFLVEGIAASLGVMRPYALMGPDGVVGAIVAAGMIRKDPQANLAVKMDAMEAELEQHRIALAQLLAHRQLDEAAERQARAAAAAAALGLVPCGDCGEAAA